MSEFREPKIKVCKVDIKVLLEKYWVGPPTHNISGMIIYVGIDKHHMILSHLLIYAMYAI